MIIHVVKKIKMKTRYWKFQSYLKNESFQTVCTDPEDIILIRHDEYMLHELGYFML